SVLRAFQIRIKASRATGKARYQEPRLSNRSIAWEERFCVPAYLIPARDVRRHGPRPDQRAFVDFARRSGCLSTFHDLNPAASAVLAKSPPAPAPREQGLRKLPICLSSEARLSQARRAGALYPNAADSGASPERSRR